MRSDYKSARAGFNISLMDYTFDEAIEKKQEEQRRKEEEDKR